MVFQGLLATLLLVVFLKGPKVVRRSAPVLVRFARSSVDGRPIRTTCGTDQQVICTSVEGALMNFLVTGFKYTSIKLKNMIKYSIICYFQYFMLKAELGSITNSKSTKVKNYRGKMSVTNKELS